MQTANAIAQRDHSKSRSVTPHRAAQEDGRSRRNLPQLRLYEIAHLTSSGHIKELKHLAPAHPAFENAFSAFSRGLMFDTEHGPISVEDLLPGDRLRVAGGGFRTLLWKGSIAVTPDEIGHGPRMMRISVDAFGYDHPARDSVFGKSARIYRTSPGIRNLTGQDGALLPVTDLEDGITAIGINPISPVKMYHLAMARHERLTANGIEVESYHPGTAGELPLRGVSLTVFENMFPHISQLADFGPLRYQRLRAEQLDRVAA